MISLPKDNIRESIWVHVWALVASASNCARWQSASTFADACLKEFDKRFPQYANNSAGIEGGTGAVQKIAQEAGTRAPASL